MTQAVQRLVESEDDRFIDLYQGKPTAVRAYFSLPDGRDERVQDRARRFEASR